MQANFSAMLFHRSASVRHQPSRMAFLAKLSVVRHVQLLKFL